MISFFREVMNLRAENHADNFAGEIRKTLDKVRANCAPGIRRPGFSYARVVRAAFEDIRGLMAEGFSYAVICEALERDGLLREGARPYSLSRALRREGIRRQKLAGLAQAVRFPDDADKKTRAAETSPALHEAAKPELENPNAKEKSREHEWVRKITDSTEETGLGKLTKHSDGSFDFDWK
jgi:hypothetical protein